MKENKSAALSATTRHLLNRCRFAFSARAADIAKFRGHGRGARCFIMGGGPSLKKIDPTFLANEQTFGVNAIYLIKDWLGFLPSFYVVEDKLVVEDRGAEIAAMRGPTKFYDARYNGNITPDPNTNNFRMFDDYGRYFGFPDFSRDASKGLWCGGTVTYLCLQLAWYMEYDPVYLIGIDHNYSKPETLQTEGYVWTSQSDDPNHFHPDYFGKGKRWHDPQVDRMEMAYKRAHQEFNRVGRRVINATVGGKLDVFPRADFAAIFS